MKDIDIVTVLFILLFGSIVYISGLNVPVLEIDSAQYASISREMSETGSYLQVHHRGEDYLDKPPLLFWLSSISLTIFGISAFAFKLPSFLFSILGFYSTYRLGTLLYNRFVGLISMLILFTTEAIILFNQDVRTDTMLTGAVIFAIWQLYLYIRNKKWQNFIFGFLGISLAMLAKGPIGLMVPLLAIGSDLLIRKRYKEIFNPIWLLGILIVAIILLPMTYGLYQQFGWNGVKFYYWTQSFGRITGENVWKNDTGYLFFVHTYFWAYLPYSFIGIFAIITKFKELISYFKNRTYSNNEFLTLSGFILSFIALSFSKYKLPHYIFVVFPLLAIMTGYYFYLIIEKFKVKNLKFVKLTNYLVVAINWILLLACAIVFFPENNIALYLLIAILLILNIFFIFQNKNTLNKIFIPLALSSITLNLVLNISTFPQLLEYQSGIKAAKIYKMNKKDDEKLIAYRVHSHSLDFYSEQIIPNYLELKELESKLKSNNWIITDEKGYKELKIYLPKNSKIWKLQQYHVALLNLKFLNPKTRNKSLSYRYLIMF